MFRWLKDRKKSRKPSSGSVRSKEDDYGFKQKSPEWKRDLPPTPLDSASSSFTDDDKSFHIYEEIPDLPFRCTPEGELRISLVREAVASSRQVDESRKETDGSLKDSDGSRRDVEGSVIRNVSPYMVVPLERLSGTPQEFQTRQQDESFACALVGRWRSPCDGPGCGRTSEDASQGPSTPSCDESSVFSTPLGLEGRCAGLGGGDISDRLLSAINLTRLLAALRLSSSSGETCTTSPICIGVDKDGRNISVSVSVTPTTTISANNDDENDVTQAADVTDHFPETELSATGASQRQTGTGSSRVRTETGLGKPQTPTGLRFLPSPSEQHALSEILQLRPGESTELDPATLDAIIMRLCSESLPPDLGPDTRAAAPGTCSNRHSQDLGHSETALDDTAQCCSPGEQTAAQFKGEHHQSPRTHRAENSDTCYEYDISTSSESDQTNYDYFLSKVARTRSLESQVKRIIKQSESTRSNQDSDKEGDGDMFGDDGSYGGGSISTASGSSKSNSCRQRRFSPEVDISPESDDGTMADLSESENSSGYYESAPVHGVLTLSSVCDKTVRFAGVSDTSSNTGAFSIDRSRRRFSAASAEADNSSVGKKSESGVSDPETHLTTVASFSSHSRKGSDPIVGLATLGVSQAVSSRPQHSRLCKGKCSASRRHYHNHHHSHRHRGQRCGGKGRLEKRDRSCDNDDETFEEEEDENTQKNVESDFSQDVCAKPECHELSYGRDHKDARSKRDSHDDSSRSCKECRDCDDSAVADSDSVHTQKRPSAKCRHDKSSRRSHKDRAQTKWTASTKPSKDNQQVYTYLFDHHSTANTTSTSPAAANLSRSHKTSKSLKGRDAKGRSSPLEDERVVTEGVYGDRTHAGEVYSIPAALPDPVPQAASCSTGRGLKASMSVPSKLSVSRQIPESSEVYGTRSGMGGCHNRLLSDLIMLNYNRQVFNHV